MIPKEFISIGRKPILDWFVHRVFYTAKYNSSVLSLFYFDWLRNRNFSFGLMRKFTETALSLDSFVIKMGIVQTSSITPDSFFHLLSWLSKNPLTKNEEYKLSNVLAWQ